ncbi:hypothetical protein MPSEU_000994200 [Mayamaea pseudoterrestris]|nr:hypothetical protein MPSEU_000994200 [Mayamaea pseudoterrestris]
MISPLRHNGGPKSTFHTRPCPRRKPSTQHAVDYRYKQQYLIMAPSADAVVGMMDPAYFVGRNELLKFINNTLDLKLQKIEQTAPGHVACQLVDMMFPNCIQMSKVNWGARNDYEYVQNYKLLQEAFTKNHVQRHIDVDKLIRAKYQDNLEFMQWCKAFFDHSGAADKEGYNPAAVRAKGKGGSQYNQQFSVTTVGIAKSAAATRPSRQMTARVAPKSTPCVSAAQEAAAAGRAGGPLRQRAVVEQPIKSPAAERLAQENKELLEQVTDLNNTVGEYEKAIAETEKERNFYFEKLRYCEILLQVHQEQEDSDPTALVEKLFAVLYAVPEHEVAVNGAGEIVNAADLTQEDLDNELENELA